MIEYLESGNLLRAGTDALVNTVNTKGVMGKGIALQFKRAFPENYKLYRRACERDEVELGRMFVTETGAIDPPRFIINFPTKGHWKSKSRLADIEAGLADLRRIIEELQIASIAVPPLGCGLGGLNWADVRPLIESALSDVSCDVRVFSPAGAPPPESMPDARDPLKMTPGRAAFIGTLDRYLAPGDAATPLALQKLLYFLQEAGQSLSLRFEKQQFGPYADQVRHVISAMEGQFVIGFGDGTGARDIRVLPEASGLANDYLADHPETIERFERVAALIDGFETPYGLELLATAHWVAVHEGASSSDEAVERVQAWSQRKGQLFTERHITSAWNRLADERWLEPAPPAPA